MTKPKSWFFEETHKRQISSMIVRKKKEKTQKQSWKHKGTKLQTQSKLK